jgi:ATP-dependent Lon protease
MSTDKKTLPLLTLRDVIIFPGTIAPIFIGREKSLNSLLAAKKMEDGQHILLTTQKKQDLEDPKVSDLYNVGVLAKIIQTVKLPNNNAKILVEAVSRVALSNIGGEIIFLSDYSIVPDKEVSDLDALNKSVQSVMGSFKEYAKTNKKINLEILNILNEQKNPSYITNIIASHLTCKLDIKQKLLEEVDVLKRSEMLAEIIITESTYRH